jgi:hypothetical protein
VHKIVLDTNVLISAIISSGYPNKILRNVIAANLVELVVSSEILSEYEAVIKYTRFSKFPGFANNAEIILEHVKRVGQLYKPTIQLHVIKDAPDNRFLELGVTAKANFLITGNTRDFTFKEYDKLSIISPKDYYTGFWE